MLLIIPGIRLIVTYFSPSIAFYTYLKGASIAQMSSTIIQCSLVRLVLECNRTNLLECNGLVLTDHDLGATAFQAQHKSITTS